MYRSTKYTMEKIWFIFWYKSINYSYVSKFKYFAIIHKDSFPYNAIDIEILTDRFHQTYTNKVKIYNNNIQYNDNESRTYFAAWTMPLPNTIPLYFIQ